MVLGGKAWTSTKPSYPTAAAAAAVASQPPLAQPKTIQDAKCNACIYIFYISLMSTLTLETSNTFFAVPWKIIRSSVEEDMADPCRTSRSCCGFFLSIFLSRRGKTRMVLSLYTTAHDSGGAWIKISTTFGPLALPTCISGCNADGRVVSCRLNTWNEPPKPHEQQTDTTTGADKPEGWMPMIHQPNINQILIYIHMI